MEGRDQVHLDDGPEVVEVLVDRRHDVAGSRVVDDDVDTSVPLHRRGDECGGCVGIAEVGRYDQRVAQLAGEGVEAIDPPGGEHDARARSIEDAGEPETQPRARTGDDRDAPVETELPRRIEGKVAGHGGRVYGCPPR